MTREYSNYPTNQAQAPVHQGLGERDLPWRMNKTATNEHATQPKQTGEATYAINRYNPAAIQLRTGILLGMKLDLFDIGSQLRHAYLSDEQAKSRNLDMERLAHLRKVLARLENVVFLGGGKPENLKKAILEGKGNNHKTVPLGFDGDSPVAEILGSVIYQNEVASATIVQNGHGSLGEVTTVAAIAVASDMLAAVATIVKQVGDGTGTTSEAAPEGETAPVPEYQAPATDTTGNEEEPMPENSPVPHLESAKETFASTEKAAPAMEPINSGASNQHAIEQHEPEEQPNAGIVEGEDDSLMVAVEVNFAIAPTLNSTTSNAVQKLLQRSGAKNSRDGTAPSHIGKLVQKGSARRHPRAKTCRPQIRHRFKPNMLRGDWPHPYVVRAKHSRMRACSEVCNDEIMTKLERILRSV